jgi:glycosyltransferase involved in cell wall biosynthesis
VKVIGFGTYDRAKHPRVGILLDGLAQLGVDVSELNAPLGFSTAERVAMLGRPWLGYRLVLRLIRRWLSLTVSRLRLRGDAAPDAVLVGYLGHFDVILARLLFPRTPIALDLLIFAADTARDRGVQGGIKLALLDALDRIAITCASIVLLDTDEHLSLLTAEQRPKGLVVPVGSPDDWFNAQPPQPHDGPLRVIFYGLFTPLQGAPIIGEAIAELPANIAIELLMIGAGQDLAETRRRAGDASFVSWREWVEPDELRTLVQRQDVCLGIFGESAKAQRVTPNKVFQGAAAGCAVLTADTGPQRRSLDAAAYFVPAGNSVELAKALGSLAAQPSEVHRLRVAAHQRAEAEFRPRRVAQILRAALTAETNRKRPR